MKRNRMLFLRLFKAHFFVIIIDLKIILDLEPNFDLKSFLKGSFFMESRVALIGVIIENYDSVEKMNNILHIYAPYIIGRMGVPYPKRGISIVSIALDAPSDEISALSGKLGMLPGISTKTIYSKVAAAE